MVERQTAKRLGASQCLFWCNSLIGDAIQTCHHFPDRPEHGDRHVVRNQSHVNARIDEIAHRRDLTVPLRRKSLLEEVHFLEDIAMVCGVTTTPMRTTFSISRGDSE